MVPGVTIPDVAEDVAADFLWWIVLPLVPCLEPRAVWQETAGDLPADSASLLSVRTTCEVPWFREFEYVFICQASHRGVYL